MTREELPKINCPLCNSQIKGSFLKCNLILKCKKCNNILYMLQDDNSWKCLIDYKGKYEQLKSDNETKDKRIKTLEKALYIVVDHFNCTDIIEDCQSCSNEESPSEGEGQDFNKRHQCNNERVQRFIKQAEAEEEKA